MYVIIKCRKCGRYLYADQDNKTRQCVCGAVIKLKNAVVYDSAATEREAGDKVRALQEGESMGDHFSFHTFNK